MSFSDSPLSRSPIQGHLQGASASQPEPLSKTLAREIKHHRNRANQLEALLNDLNARPEILSILERLQQLRGGY